MARDCAVIFRSQFFARRSAMRLPFVRIQTRRLRVLLRTNVALVLPLYNFLALPVTFEAVEDLPVTL